MRHHACMNHSTPSVYAGIGNVVEGRYRYMSDLFNLEAASTGQGPHNFRPATPLCLPAWRQALANHPDSAFVHYILNGIAHGADRAVQFVSSRRNMPSVQQQPLLVAAHINEELVAGRVLGPLPPHLAKLTHTSSIGLIPKLHQPGKWRLIIDLSSPSGHSINDAISSDHYHMQYASVLDAARLIQQLGVGTLLAKIFSALADALAWILQANGVSYQLHYLDDFLLLGPPDQQTCAQALHRTIQVCQELGVPIAVHKTEGPAPVLPFLGILIDSIRMELSLPPEKVTRITAMVMQWRERKAASKRELQSLIGTLSHAATAVPPGRTFLRRMIETMSIPKCQHHHVRLNAEFQSDIQWWACFLPQWNGGSMFPQAQAAHSFWSDSSGSWGCGAVCNAGHWFQVEWPQSWIQCHIAAKEMVPVVIAVAIWGQAWQSSTIKVRSDNMAVVCALSTGVARDPLLMHLLRCLHFFTAHFKISLQAVHIAGVDNIAADALSRNKPDVFWSCSPQASPAPSVIPQSLLEMLLHHQPDWTSSSWRRMFLSSLGKL